MTKAIRNSKGQFLKGVKLGPRSREVKEAISRANKSGEYLRDLSDWLSLCVSCHRKYDFKFNIKKHDRFGA